MHKLILPLFFAVAAPAQRLSFGVKAGVPVTEANPYEHAPYSMVDTGRWTIGPTVELRLFAGLSFEFDALYRGFRVQESSAFAVIPAQNATGNWIKVVQRLPVRIALDPKELMQHPLRVGLSMDVSIDVSGR